MMHIPLTVHRAKPIRALFAGSARRGFTLLISVVFSAVVLALGVSLFDIAYKQITLASSAKQSEYAFYNADSALECTLYYDQKFNAFSYGSPMSGSSIICDTRAVVYSGSTVSGGVRTSSISMPCASGGYSATVTILKNLNGTTNIYANGYNTCDASNPNRIERGLKINY